MTLKKHILPLIISASLLGGTAMAANSTDKAPTPQRPACQQPGPKQLNMMSRLTHTLNLTEEQQTTIQPIIQSARKEAKPLERSLAKDRFDFMQATTDDSYDQNTIDKLAQKQAQSITQLMLLKANTIQNIKKTLTPDQQTKLDHMQIKQLRRVKPSTIN